MNYLLGFGRGVPMHAGFKLEIDDIFTQYREEGQKMYDDQKSSVKDALDELLLFDGSIDGSKVQDQRFPQIHADIFISHAHANEDYAIGLAGFLSGFDLTTFIDSCVWGYADDLLRQLDDEYCVSGSHTYDYRKRNYSTSHVHMMLATALTTMIDNTECVLFLKSPESITSSDVINNRTKSPWIYHELAMTRMIRTRDTGRRVAKARFTEDTFEKSAKSLEVAYVADLNHLHALDIETLTQWARLAGTDRKTHVLDHLYDLCNIRR